jgi:hypothetical protein
MVYLFVRQRVEDYAMWREGYDNHAAARQAGGATGEVYILRNTDDPLEITTLLGWNDLGRAKTFAQSASLKQAMQNAGVVGQPEIRFLEMVD